MLIVAGVAAGFVVLEVLLQTAGLVVQRRSARLAFTAPDTHLRLLFIGESTTAGLEDGGATAWPRRLEARLRKHFDTSRITVTNRAVVGVDSTFLASHIDDWLEETRPHLVVSMMGINDDLHVLSHHTEALPTPAWLPRLRTVRLLTMLWRTRAMRGFAASNASSDGERHPADPALRDRMTRLHEAKDQHLKNFHYSSVLPLLAQLAEEDPGTPAYHLGLQKDILVGYEDEHSLRSIVAAYDLSVAPGDIELPPAGESMDRLVDEIGSHDRADPWLVLRLRATAARWSDDLEAEMQHLETAGDREDIGLYALLRLAHLHYRRGQAEMGDAVARRLASEARAGDEEWMLHALQFYLLHEGRYAVVNELSLDYVPADEVLATRSRLYFVRRSAMSHHLAGDETEAAAIFEKEKALQLAYANKETVSNYRTIATKVAEHGSLLAAVQYPTLSIEPLERMLHGLPVFAIVDNRNLFLTAVREHGYFHLFSDLFAGSFGHLTATGHDLLADSVFRQLLAAGLAIPRGDSSTVAAEAGKGGQLPDGAHREPEPQTHLVAPSYLPFDEAMIQPGQPPESHVFDMLRPAIVLDGRDGPTAETIEWQIPVDLQDRPWHTAVSADVMGVGSLASMTLTEGDAVATSALYAGTGRWQSLTVTSTERRPATELRIDLAATEAQATFKNVRVLLFNDDRFDHVVDRTTADDFLIFKENVFRGRHGRKRIGVIGNSTVAGQQASSFHSIPFLLQMKVETSHPGVFDVLNLGRNASTLLSQTIQFFLDCNFQHFMYPGGRERSFETFTRLVRECSRENDQAVRSTWRALDLDAVVLGSMWNDAYELNAFDDERVPLYRSPGSSRPLHIEYFEALFEYLESGSPRRLDQFSETPRFPLDPTPDQRRSYTEEVYAYLVEKFLTFWGDQSERVFLFSLPEATGGRPDLYNLFPQPNDGEFLPSNEHLQRAALERVATTWGVPYVDTVAPYHALVHEWRLTPRAMSDLGYFLGPMREDMIHLDNRGNAFVADELYAALRPHLDDFLPTAKE